MSRAYPDTDWIPKMQIPEWTKPALLGAAAGGVAMAVAGFGWGGWMTSSAAAKMSNQETMAAVATVLTPYCVEKSQMDPESAAILEKLSKARSYQRRVIIEDAGWATPLGAEKPDRDLAEACQIALTEST